MKPHRLLGLYIAVSLASETLLKDVGRSSETVATLLGEHNVTSLIIAPTMFVGEW